VYSSSAGVDYAAYVLEREPSTPMPSTGVPAMTPSYTTGTDPIGPRHYDIVTPFAPTALALCAGTASSPGLTSSSSTVAFTPSQFSIPTGEGRPLNGYVRAVQSSTTGGYVGTAFLRSDATAMATNHFTPLSAFQRLCIVAAGIPSTNNFNCGPG
jgi:hypothetical protein